MADKKNKLESMEIDKSVPDEPENVVNDNPSNRKSKTPEKRRTSKRRSPESPIPIKSPRQRRSRSRHRRSRQRSSRKKKRRRPSSSSSSSSSSSNPSRANSRNRSASTQKRKRETSPLSIRKRHKGNTENPAPSSSLVLFGLPMFFKDNDLKDLISPTNIVPLSTAVATDRQGLSRGFGFLNFDSTEDATLAHEYIKTQLEDQDIYCKFSITSRSHSPTPNYYVGCKKTLKDLSKQLELFGQRTVIM